MNIMWYIVALIWIVGSFVAYNRYISKWDNPKGEKIYFSIIWPLVAPLYVIHYLHNKM